MALEVWDAQRDIKNLFITPEIRARIMRFDAHELSGCPRGARLRTAAGSRAKPDSTLLCQVPATRPL
jgi:hypothetical protein